MPVPTLALITGVDVPAIEFQTVIHQPKIKEIAMVGELEYFSMLQLLCFNKQMLMTNNPQGSSNLAAMNNFQIFMTLVSDQRADPEGKNKFLIQNVLGLFFQGYTAQFTPRSLFFNNSETKHNFAVDENNFDIFQEYLRTLSGVSSATGGKDSSFNPVNEKAAKIAAKLMRGRARAAASKGEGGDGSVLSRYVSVLTIGLQSMSLDDCLNLTVFQLYDLIERYGLYISWDLDIKSRLAGGKPDSKPDDWMKNIH